MWGEYIKYLEFSLETTSYKEGEYKTLYKKKYIYTSLSEQYFWNEMLFKFLPRHIFIKLFHHFFPSAIVHTATLVKRYHSNSIFSFQLLCKRVCILGKTKDIFFIQNILMCLSFKENYNIPLLFLLLLLQILFLISTTRRWLFLFLHNTAWVGAPFTCRLQHNELNVSTSGR